jgi:hypothetical protein
MILDPYISSLDLEAVAFKVCIDEGWSLDQVDQAEAEYRKFLQLIRRNSDDTLAPSRMVDRFWHHHILDTKKYIDDCQSLFGEYIHHYPYSGLLDKNDKAQQEKRLERTKLLSHQ